MRQSETMRAASRLLLSHPIVCLLAALAAAVVGVVGPIKLVHAADVASPVEGENFARPPTGTVIVTDSTRGYSGGQALKFTANVTASYTVNCTAVCDVVLRARGGQSGGSPTFSVNGQPAQAISSSSLASYTYNVTLDAGPHEINVTAGNVATGRNAFLDIASFPADGGTTTPPPTATPLYPNLKTLTPRDLQIRTQTINGTSHKVLRFSNTVWNAGEGRLELRAKTVSTSSGKKTRVNQYVYDNAGGFTSQYVGDMVFHSSHNHFHFQDFARYELWTRADYDNWVASNRAQGQAIKRGTKTTFCIMDTNLVQRLQNSPSSRFYDSCSPSIQGLSVGWGDTYGYNLPDQWIDLGTSSLPDGDYVLRSVADPNNRLYESTNRSDTGRESEQDNEAVTFFRVQGSTISIT
jgi:lysyl oxidase